MDEHWKNPWKVNSDDRWDIKNLDQGWNLEEVEQEFDAFFATYDPSIISDDHLNSDLFQMEL